MFLLHPNQPLTTDRLLESLWGETPPATADKALQGHVSALRKALGHDRLLTERGAYRLDVRPGELDLDRFSAAVAAAGGLLDPARRAGALADALAMWRGEPLADLTGERFAQPEIARLAELHLAAIEAWAEAEVAAGNQAKVLPELDRLVADHPLSEGLRANLMLALYRAGRQSDALRVFREARRQLAEDLGIEPGTELQQLERQILDHDPSLDLPAATQLPPTPTRQERKTVTVLVVEVVPGSSSDPEDLERLVQPALQRIRMAVERVGGRAEPLFANAILGMFGVPRAHDDDALRAIRAALELLAADAQVGLELRGGIETGDALVTIDGDDVSVTGQVLSAASRLQATAATGVIVAGPTTHRATDGAVEYRPVGSSSWAPVALRPVAEREGPDRLFVGRDDELGQLERIFARARDARSVQLVTVTAEPGGGKSRLVRELRHRLDAISGPGRGLRWLQGQCLPYGDGVTYWALGEILKDWAGILESDDSTASAGKLDAALAGLEPDDDRRAWLARSAAPLIGIEGIAAAGEREQAYGAWRQLIESIAGDQALVVVFEDIHWADDALFGFIDHLVDHAAGVPLLVLCTARLELLDARPTWGGGKRNATNLLLQRLSDADTERLLDALLGRSAAPETVRRAGGNPLYAHELARVLGRSEAPATEAIPESLQAVIAAHLDALTPDLKSVAADASVVGEVFWPGAIAEIGGTAVTGIEARLHRLAANEVVRRRRRSSVGGQDEYEFVHVLVRDVAYGQIPRRDRIAKHRATAAWIERLAGDRPAAHAELIAHHYGEAFDVAQRLGDDRVADLRAPAVAALTRAGDSARTLDVVKAESLYRRALAIAAGDDPQRGRLLGRLGLVTQFTGRPDEAEELCRAAIATLEALGDDAAAAEVMVNLVSILWRLGRAEEERRRILLAAIDILQSAQPGKELVLAYSQMAALELYEGRAPGCLEWSSKALKLADQLGAAALKCEPVHYVGIARFEMGDLGGIDDVRAAVQIGLEAGLSWETGTAQTDLGAVLWLSEGPAAGLAAKRAAAAFAADRELTYMERTTHAESLWLQYDAGDWDDLIGAADALVDWERERGSGRVTMIAMTAKARVLLARGDHEGALDLEAELLQRARALGDSQDLVPAFATAAAIRAAVGDGAAAVRLVGELAAETRDRDPSKRAHELPMVTRVAVAWGAADLARAMIPSGEPNYLRSRLCIATSRAILAEADGELEDAGRRYADVANGWAAYGCPFEEAQARIGLGRCLVALGRTGEAAEHLRVGRLRAGEMGAVLT